MLVPVTARQILGGEPVKRRLLIYRPCIRGIVAGQILGRLFQRFLTDEGTARAKSGKPGSQGVSVTVVFLKAHKVGIVPRNANVHTLVYLAKTVVIVNMVKTFFAVTLRHSARQHVTI